MNIQKLKKLAIGEIRENVPYKALTTYQLKGKARVVVYPTTIEKLKKLLTFLKAEEISFKIIGGGSNLIFKNEIYEGVLICLSMFHQLEITDNQVKVGCGYPTQKLAFKISRLGFTGLEFGTGIPGTIGGAVFNNAGAYGSDMGYVVLEATVLTPELEIKKMRNKEMKFHYRTSFFKDHPGYIILEVKMLLKRGNKEKIMEIIEDRKMRRLASQPLEFPSAGSVFRNPENVPVGKLIEDLGYKGFSIGDACVSEKHANFIINKNNATGKDIISLIEKIQKDIYETYQIEVVLEQEIVE